MKKQSEINNGLYFILGFIFSTITVFISFLLFYEYFFERYYWINRIELYKMLKNKEISIISSEKLGLCNITELKMSDNSRIWIYPDNTLTYDKDGYDYIGLFINSPIMRWYHKQIIKMLKNN